MRLLLVLAIVSAGCLGASDAPADPDPTPNPTPGPGTPSISPTPTPEGPVAMLLDFTYDACSGAEAMLDVPTDTVQALLPENYAAASTDGNTVVQWRFMGCTFTSGDLVINGTTIGHVAAQIEPLEADADEHWYLFQMIADEGIMGDIWEIAGYEVARGNITQTQPAPPIPQTTIAAAGYEQSGTTTTDASDSMRIAYYTETAEGRLEWTEDAAITATAMVGTIDVPSTDPFAGQDTTNARLRYHADTALTGIDVYLTGP